ncbi:MAG: hypothetical protein IJ179_00915 [Oscillospiraceae bacterium]|nr:hypothetical protein [Oscillospiraceae bacterium]
MKRNKKRMPPAFYTFILSLFLLSYGFEPGSRQLRMLFLRTPLSLRRLQMIWHASPATVLIACGYLLLILIMIISFVRWISPRKKAARPVPRAVKPPAESEDALHCDHRRGKEKYLQQLDNYLASGLIEREEYRVLRARYEKLEIDDDYH